MSWDRPSDVERELVQGLPAQGAELHRLALHLAPALRIEPRLLRNLRLALLPESDAELENHFWFSHLIGSRSARAVTLRPGIARLLTERLVEQPERCRRTLERIRANSRHWPELDRLEQELRWQTLEEQPTVGPLLQTVLQRIAAQTDPAKQRDLARWAKGALAGLGEDTQSPERAWLLQYAAASLGDPAGGLLAGDAGGRPLPEWLRDRLPPLQSVRIGIRLYPGVLECLTPDQGGHDLKLPGPMPVSLLLRCEKNNEPGRWVQLWPGRRLAVPPGCRTLTLQSLHGHRWWLKVIETDDSERTEPAPAERRVMLVYNAEDEMVAQRLARWLEKEGLQATLVAQRPDSEPPTEMPEPDSPLPLLRLWSREAEKSLDSRQVESPVLEKGLILRIDAATPPPGLSDAHILDLSDWLSKPDSRPPEELLRAIHVALPQTNAFDEGDQTRKVEKTVATHPKKETVDAPFIATWSTKKEVFESLFSELEDPETPPPRRLEIGDELAKLGDPRPGVGLDEKGLPDIDWVEIPSGAFLYGKKKQRRKIEGFRIARHPVTNAQFQAFIDAGGYAEKQWWQDLAKRIESPAEPSWKQPNRPRETVSWYEAIAFCRWLSAQRGEEIRLPTEEEWERAARGTDGREYPWGDGYRSGYANVDEKERKGGPYYLQQTTAVGLYPQGQSPEGFFDMAGNVWEWCLNEHRNPSNNGLEGTSARVLRGGSWFYDPGLARASLRDWFGPGYRYRNVGFRLLCSAPIR